MEQNLKTSTKGPYQPPKLHVYGSLTEMTTKVKSNNSDSGMNHMT